MTAAELIRSARSRAGLAQHELARLLDTPRSQIGRWEAGEVEPAFATVRRVLRACGFDLSMALVPFDPDAPAGRAPGRAVAPDAQGAPRRGAHARRLPSRLGYPFDPYAVLRKLDERGVEYILVGALARVLQGADEIPEEFDLVIPKGSPLREPTRPSSRFAMRGVRRRSGRRRVVLPATRGLLLRVREIPEGTRATATCAGAPSVSTSAAASGHGSPRRVIWFG